MAHAGDLGRKLEAIQNVESRVVAPILSELTARGEDFRLLLLSDHPTLLTTRTHDGSPVPYAIYDSRTVAAARAAGRPAPMRKSVSYTHLTPLCPMKPAWNWPWS